MDYFLTKLTDLTLRRVYKFILKRTIGKYLENDLLIDQLQVVSREGVVRLTNLHFNAKAINEEFLQHAPVKLVSVFVSELEVHVSYNTLLTDSCRFIVDKAEIVFEPNPIIPSESTGRSSPESPSNEDGAQTDSAAADEEISDDSQRGLSFIAHWIEIVVARLQVMLRNVDILFQPSAPSGPSFKLMTALKINMTNAQFFNTDPQSLEGSESSMAMSAKMVASQTNASILAKKLGSKKVLKFESLRIDLIEWSPTSAKVETESTQNYSHCVLNCIQSLKIDLDVDSGLHGSGSSGLSVNLAIPSLVVCLDVDSVECLLQLMTSYNPTPPVPAKSPAVKHATATAVSAASPNDLHYSHMSKSMLERIVVSDHTLKTLMWLEKQDFVTGDKAGDNDGVDFEKIVKLMKKYQTTRQAMEQQLLPGGLVPKSTPFSLSGGSGLVGGIAVVESDSDGEFPASADNSSDEEDENEEEFFDAVDRKAIAPVKIKKSSMLESTMMRSTTAGPVKSALKGSTMMGKSGMRNSTMAASEMFHSTMQGSVGPGGATASNGISSSAMAQGFAVPTSTFLKVRVHLISTDICFSDRPSTELTTNNLKRKEREDNEGNEKYNELCLHVEDAVISMTQVTAKPVDERMRGMQLTPAVKSSTKVNVTFNELELREQVHHENLSESLQEARVLVDFHSSRGSHTIYASPKFDATIEYFPAEISTNVRDYLNATTVTPSKVVVSIVLEPLVASIKIEHIIRWVDSFSRLSVVGVTTAESSNTLSLKLTIPEIDVFIHADDTVSRDVWLDLLKALDLQSNPDRWSSLPLGKHSPFLKHAIQSSGGYKFHFTGFSVDLTSGEDAQGVVVATQTVEMIDASLSVFVELGTAEQLGRHHHHQHHSASSAGLKYLMTSIMSASSDAEKLHKVRIHKNVIEDTKAKKKGVAGGGTSGKKLASNASMNVQPSEGDDADSADEFVLVSESEDDVDSSEEDMDMMSAVSGSHIHVDPAVRKSSRHLNKSRQLQENLGPSAPPIHPSNIIHVTAYLVELDVRQREYNALMIVADTLMKQVTAVAPPVVVPPPPEEEKPLLGHHHHHRAEPSISEAGNKKSKTKKGRPTGLAGFGLVLNSKFAKICLAEKASTQLYIPALEAFLAKHNISIPDEKLDDSFFLCVSIREPTIELLSLNKELFVGLKADDLSMYDMSLEQFEFLSTETNFDFNKTTDRVARFGPDSYRIPFIHRASLHSKLNAGTSSAGSSSNDPNSSKNRDNNDYEGYKFDSYATLMGDNKVYGHAFEVKLLLTTKDALIAGQGEEKSVHFFIDFHDIMLSHDPKSTWLLKVVKILTPQTSQQMIEYAEYEYQLQLLARYKRLSKEHQAMLNIHDLVEESKSVSSSVFSEEQTPTSSSGSSSSSATGLNPVIISPFEKTMIDVRVRDCLIDYCSEVSNSRCLVTIGLLTVASTIVSNSPRFGLKFKISGLALYLSNRLPLLGDIEALPMERSVELPSHHNSNNSRGNDKVSARLKDELDLNRFFQTNAFVEFLTIDHMDNNIVINSGDLEAVAVHIDIGMCSMNTCVDSLELFGGTLTHWFEEFQVACAKSETILQKKKPAPIEPLRIAPQYFDLMDSRGGTAEEAGNRLHTVEALRYYADHNTPVSRSKDAGEDGGSSGKLRQNSSENNMLMMDVKAGGNKDPFFDDLTSKKYLQPSEDEYDDEGIEGALVEDYYSQQYGVNAVGEGGQRIHHPLSNGGGMGDSRQSMPEHEAQWLPQYDYDDYDNDEGSLGMSLGMSAVSNRTDQDDGAAAGGDAGYEGEEGEGGGYYNQDEDEVPARQKQKQSKQRNAEEGSDEEEEEGEDLYDFRDHVKGSHDEFSDMEMSSSEPTTGGTSSSYFFRGGSSSAAPPSATGGKGGGGFQLFGLSKPPSSPEEMELKSVGKRSPSKSDAEAVLASESHELSFVDLMNDPLPDHHSTSSTGNLLDLDTFDEEAAPLRKDQDLLVLDPNEPNPFMSKHPSFSSTTSSVNTYRSHATAATAGGVKKHIFISNSDAIGKNNPDDIREMEDLDRAWGDANSDSEDESEEIGEQRDSEATVESLKDLQSAQHQQQFEPERTSFDGRQRQSSVSSMTGGNAYHSAKIDHDRTNAHHSHQPQQASLQHHHGMEQKAQWYNSAKDLEEFFNPHYIPIISSTEDLDDRRPAAEKLIMTKILVKLKGTFKVRLFEGQDWLVHKSPLTYNTAAGNDMVVKQQQRSVSQASSTSATSALSFYSHPGYGTSSGAVPPMSGVPKSVRFNESVLNELTAPPALPPKQSSSRSGGGSRVVQHDHYLYKKQPLFDKPKLSGSSNSAGKGRSHKEPVLELTISRSHRDMIELALKDVFLCVRMYETEQDRLMMQMEAELLQQLDATVEEGESQNNRLLSVEGGKTRGIAIPEEGEEEGEMGRLLPSLEVSAKSTAAAAATDAAAAGVKNDFHQYSALPLLSPLTTTTNAVPHSGWKEFNESDLLAKFESTTVTDTATITTTSASTSVVDLAGTVSSRANSLLLPPLDLLTGSPLEQSPHDTAATVNTSANAESGKDTETTSTSAAAAAAAAGGRSSVKSAPGALNSVSKSPLMLPVQRIVVSAQDVIISFGKLGQRRRKVLGAWTTLNKPRDIHQPMLQISFAGYDPREEFEEGADLQHRLFVRLLPLRLYLDNSFVVFAKKLIALAAKEDENKTDEKKHNADSEAEQLALAKAPSTDLFFQSVTISSIDIKIDYQASTVNLQALRSGDYLQLLNIFPLEGLELTLKHVIFNDENGFNEWMGKMLEIWVRDIYENQLHRVISGTAPFAGISNIGSDLHNLFAIPLADYKKTGGVMKHLTKSTTNLIKTFTKESLNAAHKVTIFVANAISELAADDPPPSQRLLENNKHGNKHGGTKQKSRRPLRSAEYKASSGGSSGVVRSNTGVKQPAGVVEGLHRAYQSVTREVGAAVETVIAVPIRQYEQTGAGGVMRSVIRALPIAVLRPMAGVAEGISYTMLGLRNDLDPGAKYDDEDIWNIDENTVLQRQQKKREQQERNRK